MQKSKVLNFFDKLKFDEKQTLQCNLEARNQQCF